MLPLAYPAISQEQEEQDKQFQMTTESGPRLGYVSVLSQPRRKAKVLGPCDIVETIQLKVSSAMWTAISRDVAEILRDAGNVMPIRRLQLPPIISSQREIGCVPWGNNFPTVCNEYDIDGRIPCTSHSHHDVMGLTRASRAPVTASDLPTRKSGAWESNKNPLSVF